MHYRVLGPLSPGSASARQRLLLCCLLARANRFVAADRLVEELWGEALPADPGAALRTQVSRLRRRLPADALITEPGGYRLVVAPGDLDSVVFQELLREGQVEPALALWRGAAFQEFADRAFVQAEATRLEQLRLHAEERRVRRLLMSGDAAAAATAAGELLTEEPERESVRAVLMEALYRGGQQSAALDVYQSWRQELSDQLGLDPTPELARLYQRILEQRMPLVTVPKPVDSFLGRDPELAEVRQRLRFARLVTLTGPGGVGKTRLAVEAANTVAADYPDGVTICELTAVGQSDAIARAIGWTVGLTETGGGRLEDQLVAYLRSRRMLIVLDGCEHVLDAAADIAGELLRRTTGIAILATSRERLAAPAEHVLSVPPLSAAASTRLFRDRAHSVSAGLAVTDELVAEVCSRLDGLPLALELAAARVGSLRVEDMVSALDDRFAVLADRRRSLAATLQWSYDLLSDAEREGFCRLALFQGAFDRAAANELGVDTGVLLRLAERSLVDGANPYRLLDSVRDYARTRLHEQQVLDALARQHADWVLRFAATAAEGLSTADEPSWAQRLELHFAEVRAAHAWLREHEPTRAAELSAALRAWALWRAHSEVFHWADELFAATADATAAACASTGAWQRGDLRRATELTSNALPRRAAIETLGEVAFLRGDLSESRRHYAKAAQLARTANDGLQEIWCSASVTLAVIYAGKDPGDQPELLVARAGELGSPSALAMAQFVVGEARQRVEPYVQAINLADAVGARFVTGLARVALAALLATDDPATALDQYAKAIEQWRDTGSWASQWVTLRALLVLFAQLGATREAAVLLGANQAAAHGAPAFGRDALMLQAAETLLHANLGDEAFESHQKQGASLGEDDTVSYALSAIEDLRVQVLANQGD
jgi:predicted ATPase/DNA-binding SARP family transcriptional activator